MTGGTAVEVNDVYGLYPVPGGGAVAALRGLSLRVPVGERVVVHGPNGSGKTTLLRMLGGDLAPSAGTLSIDGRPVTGADPRTAAVLRRTVLGLVNQDSGRALRPEFSVLDNVALQLRLAGGDRGRSRASALELLDDLGLAGYAQRRPATLSGGEAQRIAVCAAIAHRPAVLLADEPTGELDAATADQVYDLIAETVRRAGATLVLVTHDTRAARIADRVVRIRDGRLSEQWDPADPRNERLVLDPSGWLRLPESVRTSGGAGESVQVRERDGELVLTGDGRPVTPTVRPVTIIGPARASSDVLARLSHVSIGYGARTVLDAVNLDVQPGCLTVVRGRSGAGKSTLLRLLVGLADPDSGTVELGGTALAGLGRAARAALRREWAAVSTQSGALAETLDAKENLVVARRSRGLPAHDRVISDLIAALDLGALAQRRARLLSGGERQRVAVARSLAVQRPLVVLDEPTSQQDEAHARQTTAALVAAARSGTGVVCATHDAVVVAAANIVVDLE